MAPNPGAISVVLCIFVQRPTSVEPLGAFWANRYCQFQEPVYPFTIRVTSLSVKGGREDGDAKKPGGHLGKRDKPPEVIGLALQPRIIEHP